MTTKRTRKPGGGRKRKDPTGALRERFSITCTRAELAYVKECLEAKRENR